MVFTLNRNTSSDARKFTVTDWNWQGDFLKLFRPTKPNPPQ